MTTANPQGSTATISAGGYTATIAQVGANLAELTGPSGRALVLPSPATAMREAARGAVLAPWPNRLEAGRYTWRGETYQVPIDEVELNNANHGLALWQRWTFQDDAAAAPGARVVEGAAAESSQSITAVLDLVPTPGYPFALRLEATYTVSARGLETQIRATNYAQEPAPYALGAHPYLLAAGEPETPGAIDSWTFEAPVSTVLETNENLIPTGESELPQGLDLSAGVSLAGRDFDHAFGGIRHAESGETVAYLRSETGGVGLAFGPEVKWLQVYSDGPQRRGLAVEPMTSPANAFNTGRDFITLEPGTSHTASWRIFEL